MVQRNQSSLQIGLEVLQTSKFRLAGECFIDICNAWSSALPICRGYSNDMQAFCSTVRHSSADVLAGRWMVISCMVANNRPGKFRVDPWRHVPMSCLHRELWYGVLDAIAAPSRLHHVDFWLRDRACTCCHKPGQMNELEGTSDCQALVSRLKSTVLPPS